MATYSFYQIEISDLMLNELTTRLRVMKLKSEEAEDDLDPTDMEMFVSGCMMNCSATYVLPFCNIYPSSVARLDYDKFNWTLYTENQMKFKIDQKEVTRGESLYQAVKAA